MPLLYDSNTDYLRFTGPAGWNSGTSLTILTWVYRTTVDEAFVVNFGADTPQFYAGPWDDTDAFQTLWNTSGGNNVFADAEAGVVSCPANQWVFMALVIDDLDPAIYLGDIDTPAAEITYDTYTPGSGTPIAYPDGNTVYIWTRDNNDARRLVGSLAMFQIYWGTALTLTQVRNQQNRASNAYGPSLFILPGFHGDTTVPDLSGNGISITANNTTASDAHGSPLVSPFGFNIWTPYAVVAAGQTYNESLTEALAMTESPGIGATFGMHIKETMGTGDSLGPPTSTYGISVTEFAAIFEQMAAGLEYGFSLEETLALAETIKVNVTMGLKIAEDLALEDIIGSTADMSIAIDENMALSDVIHLGTILGLPIREDLALTDIVNIALAAGQIFNESITENLALTEQLRAQVTQTLSITENLALSDVLRAIIQVYITISETIGITDTIDLAEVTGNIFNEIITENLALTDTLASVVQQYLKIRENLALTDISNVTGIVSEALVENLGLTESSALAFSYAMVLSENLSTYDELTGTFTFNMQVSEDVSFTDVIKPILSFGLLITENFTVGEVIVLTRIRPSIVIRRGKTFVFTIDTVGPQTGVAPKKGHIEVKKWN